ncbi:oligopeptide ABC transporter substrate-binding protein OppA [Mesoplasma lactucae]|uniref:Solute-binding protein family 5 domain-containing protein n=1 Tax=Mesoplasma lactucae ATCC 49193 TaxID=81460 RepID=A0A291IR69_9MOLU|nr:oligopeptide ABC transporter substrate-binding protein OppA [Mesoplasma lactucae]ATG97250.1 hypothetical protein CP520_00545 [Mesoplasma lactucae ATCC 49193]ATZ20303.1 oligopeptide ABC transporter substrate-binding protein [Mesoplasma lactucae ATCC 49193]MCL8216474.1 hypothetical protein [Mesoplasma lactucae ATCC 49193]
MFKKLLTSLSAIAVVPIVGSNVVSCGPMTLSKMADRTVDTTTYRGYYAKPISSWSSGITMQSEDFKVLSNLVDPLLITDQYNVIKPGTAKPIGNGYNADKTEWTFGINDNNGKKPEWFDYNGNSMGTVKAMDVANAFRYVFNPSTTSQTGGLWSMMVKNGAQLDDAISELPDLDEIKGNSLEAKQVMKNWMTDVLIKHYIQVINPKNPDDLVDKNTHQNEYFDSSKVGTAGYPDGPSLTIDETADTFTFHLEQTAPYFDSLLTYVAFAPLPDMAIDWNSPTVSGYSYGRDYKSALYSGAYLPDKVNPSTSISLKKNNNYFKADETYIKKIILNYPKNQTPSNLAFLFETNDLSLAPISSTDTHSWYKYIGKGNNTETAKFGGVHDSFLGTPSTSFLLYNYGYKTNPDSKDQKPEDVLQNQVLAQQSTRALISYGMDRSKAAKFFSQELDSSKPSSAPSSLLRNVYTTPNLVSDNGKDYVEYIQDEYSKEFGQSKPSTSGFNPKGDGVILQDGSDAYKENDEFALKTITDPQLKQQFIDAKENYEAKMQILMKQVRKDSKLGENQTVSFNFLANGSDKTTLNPRLRDMFDSFSNLKNNPIKINVMESQDSGDYSTIQRTPTWNMMIAGWSPDYADPSTYLNTIGYGGDYGSYNNLTKIISKDKTTGKLKGNNKAFDALATDLQSYGDALNFANKEFDINTRLTSYSKAETLALYQKQFILPMFIKTPVEAPALSYLDQFTRPSVAYGTCFTRMSGVKMTPKLWTKEQYNQHKAEWEQGVTDANKPKQ